MITLYFINDGKMIGVLTSGIFFGNDIQHIGFYAKRFKDIFAEALSVPFGNINVEVWQDGERQFIL